MIPCLSWRFSSHLLGVGLKSSDQRDQNDDGLLNRFLIAVAYKYRPNRESIEINDQIPKLAHLFYLTKKLHRNPVEYVYCDEGNIDIDKRMACDMYLSQERNLSKM